MSRPTVGISGATTVRLEREYDGQPVPGPWVGYKAHREQAHSERTVGQQANALRMAALCQPRVERAAQQAARGRLAAVSRQRPLIERRQGLSWSACNGCGGLQQHTCRHSEWLPAWEDRDALWLCARHPGSVSEERLQARRQSGINAEALTPFMDAEAAQEHRRLSSGSPA